MWESLIGCGSIFRFDSDTAIPVMKEDGISIDYFIVQDLNSIKDY